MKLRNSHPQLYRAILGCSITYISVGLLSLLNPRLSLLSIFFALSFVLLGVAKLIAVNGRNYKRLQIIQSIGLSYALFFGILFVIAVITSLGNIESRQFAWIVPIWLFWVFAQFLTIIEPPVNPATENQYNGKH